MNGGGSERGSHRIRNRLQALSHQPRARRGARTHGPRDRDLAEVGRLTDCATQAPLIIYFWDRERQSRNGGGSERGSHRIWNRLQALSCQHRAWRGAWTHKPWDHEFNRLSHPGVPSYSLFYQKFLNQESWLNFIKCFWNFFKVIIWFFSMTY